MKTIENYDIFDTGRAVINAAENGASFPLKRRDMLLDYILTLMGRDENDDFADSSLELLHTQVIVVFVKAYLVISVIYSFAFNFATKGIGFKCLHYLGLCGAKADN